MIKKTTSLFCLMLLFSSPTHASTSYDEFYFFGDSLSDVGNNGCKTNKDGNTGECLTWANDLHERFFNTYAKPSSQGGTDYAFCDSLSKDAEAQANQYLSTRHNQADPNAYYFILTGANDIMGIALDTGNQAKLNLEQLAPMKAIGSISGMIGNFNFNLEGKDGSPGIITHEINTAKLLINAGAKHVMIINLPNMSVTPAVVNATNNLETSCQNSILIPSRDKPICLTISQGFSELADIFTRDYNDTLSRQIQLNLDPQIVKTFSMFDLTEELVQSDFLNPNGTCSGTAQECQHALFFNFIHPSAAAHQIMANKIAEMLSS